MTFHDPRFHTDDLPPIDVQLASGLKRAFALPEGHDEMFRPVLDALARLGRRGQGPTD